MTNAAPQYLTRKEVAAYLRISYETVKRLDAELRPIRPGPGSRGPLIYDRRRVEALIAARDAPKTTRGSSP